MDVGIPYIISIAVTYFSSASGQPCAIVFSYLHDEHIKDAIKHYVFQSIPHQAFVSHYIQKLHIKLTDL